MSYPPEYRQEPTICSEGRPDYLKEESVHYGSLVQHPKAVKIYATFDVQKVQSQATIAEISHFDSTCLPIEIAMFLEEDSPYCSSDYKPFLWSNIKAYTVYELAVQKKISLYAFDSSAVLTSLKISEKEEVFVPYRGKFVVSFPNIDNIQIEIIIDLEREHNGVTWQFYSKNCHVYAAFDRLFKESVKKYNYYIGKTFTHHGEILTLPDVSFDDIYLDEKLRAGVNTNIINYVKGDSLRLKTLNNIPTKRGIIFEGVPGTGKTFLSRVLAKTLGTSFMVVSSMQSLDELTLVFEFASMFDRIILLFEDIDIYMRDRMDHMSPMLPEMLNKLDGIEVNNHIIVICTTNNVQSLDEALKTRPGRFDRTFKFDVPTPELRIAMLRGFCKGKDISKVNFDEVCSYMPALYTGAHLKEIYITACNGAIENKEIDEKGFVILTTARFKDAISEVKRKNGGPKIGFDCG